MVNWSTGENAHKIVVTEGGFYSYVTTGFTCDHLENFITVFDPFPGPLHINGPSVLCFGQTGAVLTVNDYGYNVASYTWSPSNPAN